MGAFRTKSNRLGGNWEAHMRACLERRIFEIGISVFSSVGIVFGQKRGKATLADEKFPQSRPH